MKIMHYSGIGFETQILLLQQIARPRTRSFTFEDISEFLGSSNKMNGIHA